RVFVRKRVVAIQELEADLRARVHGRHQLGTGLRVELRELALGEVIDAFAAVEVQLPGDFLGEALVQGPRSLRVEQVGHQHAPQALIDGCHDRRIGRYGQSEGRFSRSGYRKCRVVSHGASSCKTTAGRSPPFNTALQLLCDQNL